MISQQFLDELLSKNDIVSVVSSYILLKRVGGDFVALCPFHNEKTASFHVYPQSDSFYCFGCETGGSIITFVQKIENLSYIDAVRFLAQKSKMSFFEDDKENSKFFKKNEIFRVNREAAKFFYSSLYTKEGSNALLYLKSRGVNEKAIRHFGIGYSDSSKFSLCNHLFKSGFEEEILKESGLVFNNKTASLSDRFLNRIMFPIIDLNGNVIGFGGRSINDSYPKYLNTKETLVFKKGTNLFSLNFAKKTKENFLILTEGYMDVISLFQLGFENIIATLGTALTFFQSRLLSKYTNNVVIAYDNDEAGQRATDRAISFLRNEGIFVKVLKLEKEKDPDEFVQTYKEQAVYRFSKLIKEAKSDIEYRLQKIKNSISDNSDNEIIYLQKAIKVLCSIKNKMEREIWAKRLSSEFGIDKKTIIHQIELKEVKQKKKSFKEEIKNIKVSLSGRNDIVNKEKAKFLKAASAEELLISYIIHHFEDVDIIFKKISSRDFCTNFNARVMKCIEDFVKQRKMSQNITIHDFQNNFSVSEIGRIAKFFASDISKKDSIVNAFNYIDVVFSEKMRERIFKSDFSEVDTIKDYINVLKRCKK
ncbi:MAG: DNA primase [Oscillospiraceae bacterium]|nr:DNA primase [Oscillospiraceae bacterium]